MVDPLLSRDRGLYFNIQNHVLWFSTASMMVLFLSLVPLFGQNDCNFSTEGTLAAYVDSLATY